MTTTYLKSLRAGPYPYRAREANVALRAIVFDCDGVLIDSEPVHYIAFKKTLGSIGAILTEELYKERYLAMDDRGAFSKFFQDQGAPLPPEELERLMNQKAAVFEELVGTEGILPFPAVPELVMALSQRYPLAIASGARKHELEILLETAGIRPYFEAVISADDVERGKPDPESYLRAIDALNASGKRPTAIRPEECVVIEDSKEGVTSAHGAGMKCVAVATSYPAFELSRADLVVPTVAALRISQIEDLFHPPTPLPVAPQSQPN